MSFSQSISPTSIREDDCIHWHELEMEDVTISSPALEAVKRIAQSILVGRVPQDKLRKVTVGDAVALLTKSLYWDEESGCLYLCSDMDGNTLCLPIPSDHWGVKKHECYH